MANIRHTCIILLFLTGDFSSASAASTPLASPRPDAPALIPRRVLFGNPDRAQPQLNARGDRLAFLAPVDGVMNVWVGPNDSPSDARPVTHDRKRGIRQYYWAYTNRHVIYLRDEAGDENWNLFTADTDSGETRNITPLPNVSARIQEVSPRFPNEILVALNDRDPRVHDLYRIDLLTCQRTLVAQNDRMFAGFITDPDFRVRFGLRMKPSGGEEYLRHDPATDTWETALEVDPDDALTTAAIGFDQRGDVLYLHDSRGRDTAAVVALDTRTHRRELLAEDARADAGTVLIHPTRRTIQAVTFEFDRKRWCVLDPLIKPHFSRLQANIAGDFAVVSRTLDDAQWIVAAERDDGPLVYYRYSTATGATQRLFANRSELERVKLATMRPVVITARDGLELVSYLTLPVEALDNGQSRPRSPLPTVLLVHGGPWARDSWGLSPQHQWLANRGYAVLSVNYRGSTGFGKKFINASKFEWARRMHDDLIDAVEWAVREKIADEKRVAIMGASYGGYAALVGLAFTPTTFACGVSIVGPSSLVTLLESIPPYWSTILDLFTSRVGDHRTDAGRKQLLDRSPLSRVERILRPLLIGQGANDPRVKRSESDQIVSAMRERNTPVTYVLFPDEGHGFARPQNRLAFFAVAEQFLSLHLQGRSEQVGTDFDGSSITVPAGAHEIPGLKDALGPR